MKIVTTPNAEHITKPSAYYNQSGLTEKRAIELFKQACEVFNLNNAGKAEAGDPNDLLCSAGGRGYDYLCELYDDTNERLAEYEAKINEEEANEGRRIIEESGDKLPE